MADRQNNDTGQGDMQNSQSDGRRNDNRSGFGASSGRHRDSSGRDKRDDRLDDGSSRR